MDRHARRLLSDEELAERARSGDSEAFAQLWERHERPGHAAARQFAAIADPEDIVAEAYLRILGAVQRGGGPHEAFRPYLYRTIRNVALGWRSATPSVPLDEVEEIVDEQTDVEGSVVESTITVRAFRSLPERWQTVLWYTEVEGLEVADAAPLLGLSPASTAALAYRARDGLRKAWLQAHVSDLRVPAECRWTTERMGEYARGGLTPRARSRFAAHLAGCGRCTILLEEIDNISGRLAAFLLPAVLGGAAGTHLLAELARDGAPSSAAEATTAGRGTASRSARGLVAAAAVVVLAGSATAVMAATGMFGAPPAADSAATDQESSPAASEPFDPDVAPEPATGPIRPPAPEQSAPAPAPAPEPPAPPPPPPPPVDSTPPARPSVASPLDGALLALDRPSFSGTGEPGARVEVSADGVGVIATAVVAGDGSWSATPTVPLPDGPRQLAVTLVDSAGNRSPHASLSLVVDTVALPPSMELPPDDPRYFLPILSGVAEPGALVEISDDTGTSVGEVSAGDDGAWSLAVPDPGGDDQRLRARQVDPAGNVSEWSAPLPPLVFERPSILAPGDGSTVAGPGGSASVTVTIDGVEGMLVQILIDGTPTGNIHTLGPVPIDRVTPPLPLGTHTVSVRYYADDATVGSLASVTFVVE